jgi:hypothetical protein
MKKQRFCSSWLIVLLLLTAQLVLAGNFDGFRWSGSQLQFNPHLFTGSPAAENVWYPAYFSGDDVVVQYGGASGDQTYTGITKQNVIDAIGEGGSSNGGSSNGGSTSLASLPALTGSKFTPSIIQYQSGRESDHEVTVEQLAYSRTLGYLANQRPEPWCNKDDSPSYAEPVEVGSWRMYYDLSSSYDEYRYKIMTRLTGEDAYGRTWRTTARAHAIKDRWGLSLSLGYKEFWGTGLLDNSDYSSLSLDFTPQYYLLQQDLDHIDLMAFLTLGGEHFWFDGNSLQDNQLDLWRYGGGLGAGRTFSFGDLWFVYLYHNHRNADGDDGLTDNGELLIHRLGGVYTVALTNKIFAQATLYYNHFSGLPKVLDSDDFEGAVKVGWNGDKWQFLVGYNQLFGSRDLRNWGIDCKCSYRW